MRPQISSDKLSDKLCETSSSWSSALTPSSLHHHLQHSETTCIWLLGSPREKRLHWTQISPSLLHTLPLCKPPKTQRKSQAGRRRWCPRAKLSDWRKPSGRRMSFMCRWGQPKLLGRQRSSVCQAWAGRVCVCVMTPVPQPISLTDHCVFRQTGCCELLRERCRTRRLALPPCSSSAGAEQSGTPAVPPATMDPDTPAGWSEAFCPLRVSGDCRTGAPLVRCLLAVWVQTWGTCSLSLTAELQKARLVRQIMSLG